MTLQARRVAVAVALALALGGCGGTSDGGLSVTARGRLEALVRQVRRAAESLDRQGTQRALAELQRTVGSYKHNGDISATRAAQILTAVLQVQDRLALVPTTTTTTTRTTTRATTAPPHGRDHGGKKDGGKGKGDGN